MLNNIYNKKNSLIGLILLNSGFIFAMEDSINNNEKKEEISKKKIGINWDQKELDVIFETLPEEVIKNILDYIFYDFKLNKENIEDLIKINDLKRVNKNFALFLYKFYSKELNEISKTLGLKIVEMCKENKNNNEKQIFNEEYFQKAKMLVDAGADVNLVENDEIKKTPLMYLLQNSNFKNCIDKKIIKDFVQLLINKKTDLEATSWRNETALIMATEHNLPEVVELLIQKGANINWKDQRGYTAFFIACWQNYPKVAEMLLKAGFNIDNEDPINNGYSVLIAASKFCSKDTLKILIKELDKLHDEKKLGKSGYEKAHEIDSKWTAIMWGCLNNSWLFKKTVKLLIKSEVNPWGSLNKIAKLLLEENKQTLNYKNTYQIRKYREAIEFIQKYLIYYCAKNGDFNKVRSYIFTTRLPMDMIFENGDTLLHAAAKSLKNKNCKLEDCLKIFLLILSENPELIVKKNKKGETPFDISPELVILLANKPIFDKSKSYLEKLKDMEYKMDRACGDKNIKEILKLSKEMDKINLDKNWSNYSSEGKQEKDSSLI